MFLHLSTLNPLTLGGVSDGTVGCELRKTDFWVRMKGTIRLFVCLYIRHDEWPNSLTLMLTTASHLVALARVQFLFHISSFFFSLSLQSLDKHTMRAVMLLIARQTFPQAQFSLALRFCLVILAALCIQSPSVFSLLKMIYMSQPIIEAEKKIKYTGLLTVVKYRTCGIYYHSPWNDLHHNEGHIHNPNPGLVPL